MSVLLGKKINETCKLYFEIENPEKYIYWQYGGWLEREKTTAEHDNGL